MAEEQKQKTRKESFGERLRAKHPDGDFTEEDAMFGRIDDDYNDYEAEIDRYKKNESELTDAFAKDPRAAQFFADLATGKDPWVAVVKHVGTDGAIALMSDPEKQEAYAEANRDYAERLAESNRLEEEYNQNMAETMKLKEGWDAQYGEETVDAALGVIDKMCKEALLGKVSPETFEMAMKVVNHDADVTNARSEGEVAGRNAKIEEKMRHKEGGDGMPQVGGANAAVKQPQSKSGFFDDLPKRKF